MSETKINDLKSISPEEKRRLLAKLLQKKAAQPQFFPQSFSQERLWTLNQLEGESATYNILMALRLQGHLNVPALAHSINEIIRRHAVLRTIFQSDDSGPVAVVLPKLEVELPIIDMSGADEEAIQSFLTLQIDNPFSLHKGPLLRLHLLQIAADEHILICTIHHIIFDGFSGGVWTRELSTLYMAFTRNAPSPLPDLALQYHDLARWQRKQVSEASLQQQIQYWQKQLLDAPPLLDLPTDRVRPVMQTNKGDIHHHTFDQELTQALKRLSRDAGVTLFTTLQSAFVVLLSRYSGQDDIVIGTPVANRNRTELEALIGFLVNTLALRHDLSDNPTFLTLLQRVQHTTRQALAHQALPFEKLVSVLKPERHTSYAPIVQVAIGWVQASNKLAHRLSDLVVTPLMANRTTAKIDLTLFMSEEDGVLSSMWEYKSDLFERMTIERMAKHFQTLLEGIVANPDQPIAHLPLLTEAERHQLLVEWNDTTTDYPKDKCIHQLFEEQVTRTPSAIAVVFDDQAVTYHELNARANQLAHYLIAQGVGANVLVGICVERSIEMVVGLLGILKAGGAYLPLDPDYPQKRIAYMLSDAQVHILLTQQRFVERLSEQAVQLLSLDRDWPTVAAARHVNLPNQLGSDNLAYVIYTSGSTGRPKGVMVPHRGINRLVNNTNYIEITPQDRMAQASNASFDAATFEIWGALLHGACLVGISRDVVISPQKLATELKQQEISILFLTTALFNQVVSYAPDAFASLRYLLFGGEAVDPVAVRKLLDYGAPEHFLHVYGPTENTTYSSWYAIQSVAENAITVPIGIPIANSQIYILDRQLEPVPVGVPGELYIGGDGLALGYLNRPKLTQERFIPNPFGQDVSERLYKTGDNVRYLPDGNIEFLGRTDYQVKIRGFRIELGEIEANLRQCVGVREVVVVAREEASGKRLVAYVVGDAEGLRTQLSQKLPDYMIPSAFVSLEAMPLTPNGKIDRRALPAPEYRVDSAQLVLPRTPVETILAAIWQEVLGVRVGVTDNFFEVGGDSIISIQIVSRAKQAGIQLTPKELFQHQTISELASVARSVTQTDAEQGVVTGTLPLTPIQHWFLEQKWREPHHFNQSFLLELTSDVNPTWLRQAVRALLTHHDALRLRFEPQGNSWRQEIVAPEPDVPFELIDLSTLNSNEQVAMLEKKANALQASLNLSPGPLVRVALFQSSATNRLLIIIHHLAVDGVSWRILLEDLQTAYQQLASGGRVQLPAKTTSFKQWSTLLNGENGTNVVADERDYWAQLSALYHDQSRLPVDYRLGPNNNASAAHISTQLSAAQTQALLNEVPAVYHTQINDLLLTALLLAFQEWTGQPTLLLELEGHGREELFEVDLSRTVGWFTTIFPLRLELTTLRQAQGTASELGEAIKSIKEQLRRIPNRGIGYGILRYLTPAAVPEAKAEVSFNYLGQFDQLASGPLIKDFATESSGLPHSLFGQRTHLLNINGMVVEGQLQLNWSYSRNFHRAPTIQKLANRFIDALQALIAHCQEPNAGGYTPSDFSAATVNQKQLDKLMTRIKRR